MEKFYYIVDSELPADSSVVAIELLTELEATQYLADNQVDLEVPYILGDGTEITKKYYAFEAAEVEASEE